MPESKLPTDLFEIQDTGERLIPRTVTYGSYAEHISRYSFAATFVAGLRVLDAGCGVGYGAHWLAQHAATVIGLDLGPEAVGYARRHYQRSNLEFLRGDVTRLPLADDSLDAVVSFEVMEHIPDYTAYLAEIRRVLKPSGLCLVSSPNRDCNPAGIDLRTRFHVKEFTPDEFSVALSDYFPNPQLFIQDHLGGVVFLPLDDLAATHPGVTSTMPGLMDGRSVRHRPEANGYVVAVCRKDAAPIPAPAHVVIGWRSGTTHHSVRVLDIESDLRGVAATPVASEPAAAPPKELFRPMRRTCPICSSAALKPLALGRRDFSACQGCGYVFANPLPMVDPNRITDSADYYLSSAYDWQNAVEHWGGRAGELQHILGSLQGKAILDYGSGPGFLVKALVNQGASAFGVDISRRCREHGTRELAVRMQDEADFLSAVASGRWAVHFDAVCAYHLAGLLDDLQAFKANVLRILKPGGCLSLEFPNLYSFDSLMKGDNWEGLDLTHSMGYLTPQTIQAWLQPEFELSELKMSTSDFFEKQAGPYLRRLGQNDALIQRTAQAYSGSIMVVNARSRSKPSRPLDLAGLDKLKATKANGGRPR